MVYSWGRFLDLDDQAVIVAINIFDKMFTEYRYVMRLTKFENGTQTNWNKCKSDISRLFRGGNKQAANLNYF